MDKGEKVGVLDQGECRQSPKRIEVGDLIIHIHKHSSTLNIVFPSKLMPGYQVKISKCLLGHDQ